MAEAVAPQVFTRRASGLVRVMSPYSAFIYNVLTMGIIFPWIWIQGPNIFAGADPTLGVFFAFLAEIPIALAYVWLATSLPRSGGDYVFQSRVFGGAVGFSAVMGWFVIMILQWVALSGWLVATFAITPLFLGLGVQLQSQWMIDFGEWASTANGIIVISVINAGVALLLLVSGFRNYVRVQFVMFYWVLASFGLMILLFLLNDPASFQTKLDSFALAVTGASNYYATAAGAAQAAGANLNPTFYLWGTLLLAPVAWTSLQWASYSVEQNGEIKNAHVFRNQVKIIVVSLIAVTALLMFLGIALRNAAGEEGMIVASSGFWLGVPEATLNGAILHPSVLGIAMTTSPILIAIIGIGFLLNSFQIVCNCYIGTTRIIVAQGLDGLLPEWFSRVHPRWKTPVNAHLAYFLGSLVVIWLFNKVPDWSTKWALEVSLANGLVFVLSALAAGFLAYRAKKVYEASPGAKYKLGNVPWVTILGWIGFVTGALMCAAFLFVPELGLAYSADNAIPYLIVIGLAVFSLIVYLVMRRVKANKGIKVEYAFAEIPPE
jgi:amino acid transporter